MAILLPQLPGQPSYELIIPLTPVPASRPRFSQNANNPKSQKSFGVTTHYGKTYTDYRTVLAKYFRLLKQPVPAELIVGVVCEFVVDVPKSIARQTLRKAEREWLYGKFCYEDNLGDVDNLLKPVMDMMQEFGWMNNDSQIGAMFGTKRYRQPQEQTHTRLILLTTSKGDPRLRFKQV